MRVRLGGVRGPIDSSAPARSAVAGFYGQKFFGPEAPRGRIPGWVFRRWGEVTLSLAGGDDYQHDLSASSGLPRRSIMGVVPTPDIEFAPSRRSISSHKSRTKHVGHA
jgi:hypothetical protein